MKHKRGSYRPAFNCTGLIVEDYLREVLADDNFMVDNFIIQCDLFNLRDLQEVVGSSPIYDKRICSTKKQFLLK